MRARAILTVFTSRDAVVYDRGLKAEQARVAYPGMPDGAYLLATELSADGAVAAIVWSELPAHANIETHSGWSPPVTVVAFRIPAGEVLSTLKFKSLYGWPNVPTMHLSPAGDLLTVHGATDDGRADLRAYDVTGGALRWVNLEIGDPYVFSSDGARIYAEGSIDDPVNPGARYSGLLSFDTRTGERAETLGGFGSVNALAVSADGRWVLGTSSSKATNANGSFTKYFTWQMPGGWTLAFDESPDCGTWGPMAMSPDGEHWASVANRLPIKDQSGYEVHLWTNTGTLVLSEPSSPTALPAFSPDGTELAVGPIDAAYGGVNVYRVTDSALVATRSVAAMTR